MSTRYLFPYNYFLIRLISLVPTIYFGEPEVYVDESDGYVEILVWRTGTDLSKTSTVSVQSRPSDPLSAECKISFLLYHVHLLKTIPKI